MTYRELYENGLTALRAMTPPNEDAALDARLFLEAVCGTDQQTLLCHGERPVSAAERGAYERMIARRAAHEPAAYILGEQYFMGLRFCVTKEVLIPEQDTEILAEEALRELHDGMRVLDLCTGSGCILLSLLHYSNDTSGVGTDLSPGALAVAAENARALGLADRCSFLEGDLYDAFPSECSGRFHLAVSNPPYIASQVIPTLAEEVRCGEPRMALDGGADGLDFYRRILAGIRGRLVTGGLLFMEIGCDQGEAVSSLMREQGFLELRVVKDYGGRDRVVRGELGG